MKQTSQQTYRARELRENFTDAENRIWYHLRNRRLKNHKFNRQVPIGNYIVDFVCKDKKLIIELDGGQHANSKYDIQRTEYLETLGYKVIRFWNNQVLANTHQVLEQILIELNAWF